MAGVFLVLDGLDGAGKSTQLKLLTTWLQAQERPVTCCRDPGGTPVGESIRKVLLDVDSTMHMTCEMLLYMSSRAELVDAVVRPALERGEVVLSDRFLLSTIVYQGYAGGVDREMIRCVGEIATRGLMPDWTGVLDLPAEAASVRRVSEDRIERRPDAFHEKVRGGFLAEAKRDPQRIRIIDSRQSPRKVHECIVQEVRRVLDTAGRS